MGMHPATMTSNDEQTAELVDRPIPAIRRISTDLALGLALLGSFIAGRLLWAISDGGLLAALGAR